MNKITFNTKQYFETIKFVDKCNKPIDIIIEVPNEPEPQIIKFPSFIKEIMMIIFISFAIIAGAIVFSI